MTFSDDDMDGADCILVNYRTSTPESAADARFPPHFPPLPREPGNVSFDDMVNIATKNSLEISYKQCHICNNLPCSCFVDNDAVSNLHIHV